MQHITSEVIYGISKAHISPVELNLCHVGVTPREGLHGRAMILLADLLLLCLTVGFYA